MPFTTPCSVKRCDNPGTATWLFMIDGGPARFPVCVEHEQALSNGAPHVWGGPSSGIYMHPEDLAGTGELLLLHYSIGPSIADACSSDPDHTVHLRGTGHPRGTEEEKPFHLVMTREKARELHWLLGQKLDMDDAATPPE